MVATSKDLQAMKKMMKNLMLVAAAAMGFTACQSGLDEITMRPTEPEKVTISIVASEAEESRTAINEDTQSFVWSEGDQIKVIENSTPADSEAAVIDENGLATFTASFTAAEGTFTYNALYPYSAYVSIDIDETTIRTLTPSIQNATATSFDPKADLLIAKPIEATQAEATPLNMSFKRLVAIGKMTFKNLPTDATIDAVTFTAPNKVIAGRSSFNYTTGQVIEYGYNSYGESSTTIKYAEAIAANNAVFFTCLPCEIVTEETFTVSVVCGDKTYTRTVTMPEGRSLLFTEGDLTTFSVDMADAAVEESFKFEDGAYVIMASNNGVYYALSNVDSGASTKRLKSVTVEYDGSGSFITTDETLVWNIKAVEDGYTIQDTNNKYIGWTSGNSSFVGDTSYSCTITPVDGGLYKIGLVTDSNRFLARNATAANEYFAFYGNTQWKELYIVPFVLDTRPSFTISYTIGDTTTELNTNDKYNFDAAGGDLYVDATRENGLTAEITATLDEECDWLYLEEEDVDLFYIEASVNNTTKARSANITFSAEGCEDVVITITQEGAPSATTTTYTYDMTVVNPSYGTTTTGYNNYTGAKAYWYANETSTFDADTELALVFGQGSASYASSWYTADNTTGNTNMNSGNTLTIEGKTISMIKFTFTSESYTGGFTASEGDYTENGATSVWTGSANKVVFTASASARITEIVVTYDTATEAEFTPAIVAVEPEAITFEANTTETSQTITATVMSYLGNITATGLDSAKYTVATNGNDVTVTALNTAVADTSTLVLGVEGGNTWNVPVKILEAGAAATTTIKKDSGLQASTTATAMDNVISYVNSAANNYSDPLRIYKNNTFTISATEGHYITEVIMEANSSSYATALINGTFAVDDGASVTTTKSGNNIIFTITGNSSKLAITASNAQVRVNSITVTYTE